MVEKTMDKIVALAKSRDSYIRDQRFTAVWRIHGITAISV